MVIKDITAADVSGDYETREITFHDGSTRTVLVVDEEVPYPDGRLIVSVTDLEGRITECNKSFVDMSAYSREELIGAQQCILRHPDIPSEIYADLWSTIKAGNKWQGYIKNLRKDGRYYWVLATIIPTVRNGEIVGYASVRRKPSRKKIEEFVAQHLSA